MASDYYLKIDGIDGESTDAKHKGEIELHSYSWGASNTAQIGSTQAGLGAGKVNMQDLTFSTNYSKASPKLLLACASGQHIAKAVLVNRKAGTDQQEFLTYTLSEVLVSSYQTGGSGGTDGVPMDTASLAFAKIEVEYKAQDTKGAVASPVKVGWDVKANKKV